MGAPVSVADLKGGRGVQWIVRAFHLYRAKPLAWIGLCAGWLLITLLLAGLLHPIGPAIAGALQPVFFGGFALAARKQQGGGPLLMGDLFSAFRGGDLRALLLVGSVTMALHASIVVAMVAMMGLPTPSSNATMTTAELVELMKGKEWVFAVGMGLSGLVNAAFWFAPPLIVFHHMSASHAVRWSVYASLSNLGAMLLYGVALVVMVLVGSIPWGVGLLVAVPLMVISTYFGFDEVFVKPPPEAVVTQET